MAYIQMKHSYKRYKTGDLEIIANNDVSFDIEKGACRHSRCLWCREINRS